MKELFIKIEYDGRTILEDEKLSDAIIKSSPFKIRRIVIRESLEEIEQLDNIK